MAETVDVRVPFSTLLKIALAILLVLCVVKLWPVILMVTFAILLAVVLDPIIEWMAAHRVRRSVAISLAAAVLFTLLIVFFVLFLPQVGRQIAQLSGQLPQIEGRIVSRFPMARGVFASIHGGLQQIPQPQMRNWLTRGALAGMYAVEALTALVFVLVVAIYLLVEGRRAFAWLVSFAPPKARDRLVRTATESSVVILAYVRGNVITSVLCAVYVFIVLSLLHVPAVLMLTVLAFVCDFVPVVGTIVQIVPAAALALTVSPVCAALTVAAYVFYHLVENYVIIPRVYGREMRLSTLTVLLSFAVGATLQGVAGAVLVLPVVAAWPIVERIWLRESLPADTVATHDRLEGDDAAVAEATTSEVLER